MDPVQNPFSPGAGTPPPELAGRGELLEEARVMIGRALNGRSTQGMLMTGLRGVGKTVILNELVRIAEEQGALPLYIEATADSTLSELLASELNKDFLYGMAECGDGIRMADVSRTLHCNVVSLSKRRASLLAKGMIYSPRYGEIAFTVPMFGRFMLRSRCRSGCCGMSATH